MSVRLTTLLKWPASKGRLGFNSLTFRFDGLRRSAMDGYSDNVVKSSGEGYLFGRMG
jgi:hypothetical protein